MLAYALKIKMKFCSIRHLCWFYWKQVLIGDKEVDDTSDLSDVASDYGDPEPIPGRQSLLVESKTIIGGKNPLQNGGSESESSADSGVKEVDSRDRSGYDGPVFLSKTDITVDDDSEDNYIYVFIISIPAKKLVYQIIVFGNSIYESNSNIGIFNLNT